MTKKVHEQEFKTACEMMTEICEGRIAYSYELVKRILNIMKNANKQGTIHHE